jgi:hypothetical protein
MTSNRRRYRAAWGAVVAGVFTHAAVAADVGYGADVGLGYTDNVTRDSQDSQGEAIATVGGQLRVDHDSRRLAARLAARLEYRDYLDDTFDSELVGNLIANNVFQIVEERFTWTLDDTFGQTTQNQFSPTTPDNRENVNHLSTGPDFTLPLGSRNRLLVSGRYIDVSYGDSNLGNQRIRGDVAVRRDLSDASSVSANVNTEQVSFDNEEQFPDFDRNEAYLNYTVDAARTNLSVDAGVAEIDSDTGKQDTWLARLELVRRTSSSLSVGLELGHDLSDAGNAFVQAQELQPGSVDPVSVQQTSMPFENTYGAIFSRFARQRTGIQLRAAYYDEQYEALPLLDRTRITIDASVSRDLNAAVRAHMGINYSRQEYESLDRDFNDLSARLGLRWSLGRLTQLSVDYQYMDRSDSQNAFDYDASELWVRLAYQVGDGPRDGGYGGL